MTSEFFSFEDIQRAGKIVPISVVEEILRRTEPVDSHLLQTDGSSDVQLTMPDLWNVDLKELDDSTITSCKIRYGEHEYFLTKRAILTLLSLVGISDRYALKAPGTLLAPHLDYWFKNEGVGKDSEIKMVTNGNYAVGFMSSSYPIVSNLEVLKQIKKFMSNRTDGADLFVDPNIVNNYVHTEFRIVLADTAFEVETSRNDVQEIDRWHFGVHVSNSLVSSLTRPLTLSGFMLEERSLAAILPEYSAISGYSRATSMDVEDLRGWVSSTLEQVFSILPAEAEMIQHMPQHSLRGKIGPLTTDLFRSMKVHRKVQELALENLTEAGDMTSYGIMHAIAKSVAGSSPITFPTKIVNHIQKVCGSLPVRSEEICDSCGRLHMFD